MNRTTSTLLLLLLLVLCACQAALLEPAEEPVPRSLPLVLYERVIISTESYERWAIYEDGTVLENDIVKTSLSLEAVAELLRRVEEAGFFDMEDVYMPEQPAPDQPLYALTVRGEEEIKTVVTMEGVPMQPAQLQALIDYVDALVKGRASAAVAQTP